MTDQVGEIINRDRVIPKVSHLGDEPLELGQDCGDFSVIEHSVSLEMGKRNL